MPYLSSASQKHAYAHKKSVHFVHFKNSNAITGDRFLAKLEALAQLDKLEKTAALTHRERNKKKYVRYKVERLLV